MPAKRSTISAGGRRTASRLPRRSRSQPSSEVQQRIATSTSCSTARRPLWACTSPVATVSHAEVLREVAQVRVPPRIAALERPLQLDVEAVAAERLRQPRGAVRVAQPEPLARAAGEADEPLVELRDGLERDGSGGSGSRSSRPGRRVPACAAVRMRQRLA